VIPYWIHVEPSWPVISLPQTATDTTVVRSVEHLKPASGEFGPSCCTSVAAGASIPCPVGGRHERVRIAVYCGNYRGQRKKHGRYAWVYAYWGFQPVSLRWLADTYRKRFGIESSYRQMHQERI
jgi:hypothetical protein